MMKSVLFIINPIAGTAFRKLTKETIADFFNEKEEYTYRILETKYAGHAIELAREARVNQFDIVVACGGDGTIREIASELLYSDIKLCIIPIGSGNGLAHHLELSFQPIKALEKITTGQEILIDACIANGGGLINEHFYSNCGFGYDAGVIHGYSNVKARGFLTYLWFLVKHAFTPKTDRATISMNGKRIDVTPFVFTVANSSQYGYTIEVVPTADISDGIMDTLLVEDASFINVLKFLFYSLLKQYKVLENYAEFNQTENIVVHFQQKTKLQLDGEPYFVEGDVEISIKKHALRILV